MDLEIIYLLNTSLAVDLNNLFRIRHQEDLKVFSIVLSQVEEVLKRNCFLPQTITLTFSGILDIDFNYVHKVQLYIYNFLKDKGIYTGRFRIMYSISTIEQDSYNNFITGLIKFYSKEAIINVCFLVIEASTLDLNTLVGINELKDLKLRFRLNIVTNFCDIYYEPKSTNSHRINFEGSDLAKDIGMELSIFNSSLFIDENLRTINIETFFKKVTFKDVEFRDINKGNRIRDVINITLTNYQDKEFEIISFYNISFIKLSIDHCKTLILKYLDLNDLEFLDKVLYEISLDTIAVTNFIFPDNLENTAEMWQINKLHLPSNEDICCFIEHLTNQKALSEIELSFCNLHKLPFIKRNQKLNYLNLINNPINYEDINKELIDNYLSFKNGIRLILPRAREDSLLTLKPLLIKFRTIEFQIQTNPLTLLLIKLDSALIKYDDNKDCHKDIINFLLSPIEDWSKKYKYLIGINNRLLIEGFLGLGDSRLVGQIVLSELGITNFIDLALKANDYCLINKSDNAKRIKIDNSYLYEGLYTLSNTITKECEPAFYTASILRSSLTRWQDNPLRLGLGWWEDIRFVLLSCPSTNNFHILCVPNNINSFQQALNWINRDNDCFIGES